MSVFPYELSSNKINASIVDSYGLTWIATEEGLNMFDGKKVHVFTSVLSDNKSLLNSAIINIIELKNKELIFISRDGLSIFDRPKFSFKRIKIPTPISVLVDDQDKKLFVSTSNNGIYVLDFDFNFIRQFKNDPLNPFSLSTNSFNEKARQKNMKLLNRSGDIIIGTDQGVNILSKESNSFQRFVSESSTTDGSINVISKLSDDMVLIGYDAGLKIFHYKNKTFTDIDSFKGVFIHDVLSFSINNPSIMDEEGIEVDTTSDLFKFRSFVLTDKGLYQLTFNEQNEISKKKIIFRNSQSNLNKLSLSENNFYVWGLGQSLILKYDFFGNLINSTEGSYPLQNLCISKDDNLLTSTINGLYVTEKSFSFLQDAQLLNDQDFDNRKINFYERIDKEKYLLVDNFNIRILSKSKEKNSPLKLYVLPSEFSSLDEHKFSFQDNKLYILTTERLVEINLDGWNSESYILPQNINFDKVKSLGNAIYLSYQNGVYLFQKDKQGFIEFEYDDLFNSDFPRGFSDVEIVENDLWISNRETGLHIFPNKNLANPIRYSSDTLNNKRVSSYSINKIVNDEDRGKVLISSQGDGLFIYNKKDSIFSQYSTTDGLLSNNIIDANYGNKYIWTVSNKGLNYFDPKEDFIYEIDQSNGLDIISFNSDALKVHDYFLKEESEDSFGDSYGGLGNTEDGNEVIELIGGKKVLRFEVDEILSDNEQYQIDLLNLKTFDTSQKSILRNIDSGILEIDSDTDFVELEMFTNNKFRRDEVEYFFQVSSMGDQFISNGNSNIIRLQSIPNYDSEVKIKAINKSGIESLNIFSFNITKTPPWYQRIESIVAYIVLLILFVLGFTKWREQSTTKKMEEERRDKELKEARELQNSLLPKILPHRKEYDISVYLKSATEIGGDYYDFFENDKKELFAICGDATGHGVVSGIMVSVTKAGLSGINMADPSSILNKLNSIVKRVNFGRLRMSLSVAKINNGSLELSSAAMPPTYYYNAKRNNVEEILVPNLPLGGISGEKFDGVKKDFNKGDVLVMISDGLPELPNREDIMLDYPMVFDCIEQNCSQSAEVIKDALVDLSDKWADGLMNPDDITIVVIKKAS